MSTVTRQFSRYSRFTVFLSHISLREGVDAYSHEETQQHQDTIKLAASKRITRWPKLLWLGSLGFQSGALCGRLMADQRLADNGFVVLALAVRHSRLFSFPFKHQLPILYKPSSCPPLYLHSSLQQPLAFFTPFVHLSFSFSFSPHPSSLLF